jgi:hypothetical protein
MHQYGAVNLSSHKENKIDRFFYCPPLVLPIAPLAAAVLF